MNNKKPWIIVSVLVLVALIGSVGVILAAKDPNPNTPTDPTDQTDPTTAFRIELDAERTELPARADAEQVKEGMSASEVYSILGKPQRDVGSGEIILEWDLSSGEVFWAVIFQELEGQNDYYYVLSCAIATPEET